VEYGVEHRDLSGVQAIGVDEIHVGKKHKFLVEKGSVIHIDIFDKEND
jgi:hypothetical protein